MEFAAAFYLKSLSEKNQHEELNKEIDALFDNNNDSIESILTFALEMLAPDNACTDILTRIPNHDLKMIPKTVEVTILGKTITVNSDGDMKNNINQAGRMRLLQTAGYTSQNIASILYGLVGKNPTIHCTSAEIQGWTKILEFKPDIFTSLTFVWSSSSGSLSELNLEKLFENIHRSKINKVHIELQFSHNSTASEIDPGEQLRYVGHLLSTTAESLENLKIKITDGIIVFPMIESLSHLVKTAENLTELQLDMELSTTNLSIITSALHKCRNIHTLGFIKSANGPTGFKHLQNLIKCGKLLSLHHYSMPMEPFNFTLNDENDGHNEYVYEDEALISEESKLKKLIPLFKKVTAAAGLHEKDVSPVEIVEGSLHPCVRYSNVYPLPICCNHKTGTHFICQALSSHLCKMSRLTLELTDQRDYSCLGDTLMTNSSLRILAVSNKGMQIQDSLIQITYFFPLLFGISCHLGLAELDLSQLNISMDAESLELSLAALSSNTALSLNKVICGLTIQQRKEFLQDHNKYLIHMSYCRSILLDGCSTVT